MSKSIASIDDIGFTKPSESIGDTKPPSGIEEPERTTERVAGFASVSPIDFIDAGTDIPTSSGTKRRGRPPGSRNRVTNTTEEKTKSNLAANLESLLVGVHFGIAKALAINEIEITEAEAKRYAESLRELGKYYPQYAVSGKTLAWVDFISTIGGIYVPRVMLISKKDKLVPSGGPKLVPPIATDKTKPAQPAQPAGPKIEVPSQMWSEGANDGAGESHPLTTLDYSHIKI